MTDVLISQEEETQVRRPYEDRGIDGGDASASQGMPQIAQHQKLGDCHGSFLFPAERSNPPILGFQTTNLQNSERVYLCHN